jgi:heme O synthase-like polyprenyltransferase
MAKTRDMRLASVLRLGKPRVVALIVFTAVIGMLLAAPGVPSPMRVACAALGIGLVASSAAALAAVSVLPFATGQSGWPYLAAAIALSAAFLRRSWRLYRDPRDVNAIRMFRFSIVYLGLLFAALVVDHYAVGCVNCHEATGAGHARVNVAGKTRSRPVGVSPFLQRGSST